jgi:hypothetical protein
MVNKRVGSTGDGEGDGVGLRVTTTLIELLGVNATYRAIPVKEIVNVIMVTITMNLLDVFISI